MKTNELDRIRICSACILIPHKTDSELFLGIKDSDGYFTLPGDLVKKGEGLFGRWDSPKAIASYCVRNYANIYVRSSSRSTKVLYKGLDENKKKRICYLATEWTLRNLHRLNNQKNKPSVETKWCTWEELCLGSVGKYNKKVKNAYEKRLKKESKPMIGKEITKMNKQDWYLGFDKHGEMLQFCFPSPRTITDVDYIKPYVFEAELKILKRENKKGRIGKMIRLIDPASKYSYCMSEFEFFKMVTKAEINNGTVKGFWSFTIAYSLASIKYFMKSGE